MKNRFHILILLFSALLMGASIMEGASPKQRSSSTVKKERQNTTQKITQTKKKLAANQAQISQRLNELNVLQSQVVKASAELAKSQKELAVIEGRIRITTDSIAILSADIEKLKESSRQSLREARTRRQNMSATSMLLNAKSFRQAVKRAGYLAQLDKSRNQKTQRLQASSQALTLKKQELDLLYEQQTHTRDLLAHQQLTLENQEKEMQSLVANLKRNATALERELNNRQKKLAELDNELDRIIAEEARRVEEARKAEEARRAEEARKAEETRLAEQKRKEKEQQDLADNVKNSKKQNDNRQPKQQQPKQQQDKQSQQQGKDLASNNRTTEKKSTKKAVATAPGATFAQSKGSLLFPVGGSYNIVGYFGRSKYGDLSRVEMDNPGIDIQASPGTTARAVYAGEVSSIFKIDGYHNIVMIRHGEYLTVYANIDQLSVRKGDQIQAGQLIGSIYSDASDSGRTILHFEVRKERQKLNPLDWVRH